MTDARYNVSASVCHILSRFLPFTGAIPDIHIKENYWRPSKTKTLKKHASVSSK